MGTILAIDPGPDSSEWLLYGDGEVIEHGHDHNNDVLELIYLSRGFDITADACAIEMVACYGMGVGREVFETCVWIGRFVEAWRLGSENTSPSLVYRRDIKLHLCNSAKAKDGNVRAALIDRFGPGKAKAIGLKKSPGPLYGISKHAWAALAIAVTYADSLAPAGSHRGVKE